MFYPCWFFTLTLYGGLNHIILLLGFILGGGVDFNWIFSLKPLNISALLPNKDTYRKSLIQKVKSFIKRIRWKAFFFERQCENNDEITTNFGFKPVNTPRKNENLNQFESGLYDMVQNIEFKNVKSNFQMQLSSDVKNIKKNPKLLVPADKLINCTNLQLKSTTNY